MIVKNIYKTETTQVRKINNTQLQTEPWNCIKLKAVRRTERYE